MADTRDGLCADIVYRCNCEWNEVAIDGDSLKQAIADAEQLSPATNRKRGKYLSTTTGLSDLASVAPISTSLPPGTLASNAKPQAPILYDDSDLFPEMPVPKAPSAHVTAQTLRMSESTFRISATHLYWAGGSRNASISVTNPSVARTIRHA